MSLQKYTVTSYFPCLYHKKVASGNSSFVEHLCAIGGKQKKIEVILPNFLSRDNSKEGVMEWR